MPRKRQPPALSPNQIVARNLKRARELRGLTQEQAGELLEPYLGDRWTKSQFSHAERSAEPGMRRRKVFSADEIAAFAAGFKLPAAFFLLVGEPDDQVARAVAEEASASFDQIMAPVVRPAVDELRRRVDALEELLDFQRAAFIAGAQKAQADIDAGKEEANG